MKRLYALLVILIVLYIGINAAAGNLPFTDTQAVSRTMVQAAFQQDRVTFRNLKTSPIKK